MDYADGAQMLADIPGMEVVKLSKPTAEEVMAAIADAEALIVRSATKVTEAMLQSSNTLKLVGRAGIGVDNIDLAAASRRGVRHQCSQWQQHHHCRARYIADDFWPETFQATASMRAGKWEKKKFMGFELSSTPSESSASVKSANTSQNAQSV